MANLAEHVCKAGAVLITICQPTSLEGLEPTGRNVLSFEAESLQRAGGSGRIRIIRVRWLVAPDVAAEADQGIVQLDDAVCDIVNVLRALFDEGQSALPIRVASEGSFQVAARVNLQVIPNCGGYVADGAVHERLWFDADSSSSGSRSRPSSSGMIGCPP